MQCLISFYLLLYDIFVTVGGQRLELWIICSIILLFSCRRYSDVTIFQLIYWTQISTSSRKQSAHVRGVRPGVIKGWMEGEK